MRERLRETEWERGREGEKDRERERNVLLFVPSAVLMLDNITLAILQVINNFMNYLSPIHQLEKELEIKQLF